MQEYARKFKGKVDCVVGLDSRGFLFGTIMALELEVPFIPIRKKGKLPGECSVTSYDLEYGSATFELQKNAFEFCNKHDKKSRTMIVDDLLATGGTMKAACDLVNAQGQLISECLFGVLNFTKINKKSDKFLP